MSNIKEPDNNLPALDNEAIRELNTKKIMDTIVGIGDYVKQAKQANRVLKYYLWAILILIVVIAMGSYVVVAISSGGVGNTIRNIVLTENLNKRIECINSNGSMEFRKPEEAYYFINLFPNNTICYIKDYGGSP